MRLSLADRAKLAHHPLLHPWRLLMVTLVAAVVGALSDVLFTFLLPGTLWDLMHWQGTLMLLMMGVQMLRLALLRCGWAPVSGNEAWQLCSSRVQVEANERNFLLCLGALIQQQGWVAWSQVDALAVQHGLGRTVGGKVRWLRGCNPDAANASLAEVMRYWPDYLQEAMDIVQALPVNDPHQATRATRKRL